MEQVEAIEEPSVFKPAVIKDAVREVVKEQRNIVNRVLRTKLCGESNSVFDRKKIQTLAGIQFGAGAFDAFDAT